MKEIILNWFGTIPYIGTYLQQEYVFSLLILILFAVLSILLLAIYSKILQKFAKKTKTRFDDMLFEHTKKPFFYLIIGYGLKISLLNLGIDGVVEKFVNSVMSIIFLFLVLRVFDVVVETWVLAFSKRTKNQVDDVVLPLFHKVLKVVFVIIGFLWVLNIWNIDITPYLAGVGLSGLVLGFALQDSLKNVFGGISLTFDKNFNIGDPVRLESGELGVVKEIGLRSTKMLTYDNEVIFIPNGQLANMRIHNYMKPNSSVRKIVEFSTDYGTDPDRVKKVVLSALKKMNDIYDQPYMDVIFVEMGDFGLSFQARFFVDWSNAYNKWVEATQVIYQALEKAKIGIPFPTQTIYVKKGK